MQDHFLFNLLKSDKKSNIGAYNESKRSCEPSAMFLPANKIMALNCFHENSRDGYLTAGGRRNADVTI